MNIARLDQICRSHGLNVTVQRRLVFEELVAACNHPTADQVFEAVTAKFAEVSRTTVYRILEVFVRRGIARKVCHPGASARYEFKAERHHHLVCTKCEAIVDVNCPSLDSLPFPELDAGFEIEEYSIQFLGICAACSQNAGGSKRGRTRAHGRRLMT